MSKRTGKISCDIQESSKEALIAFCAKHERSQGFVIDKLIAKYCVDAEPVKAAPRSKAKTYPSNLDEQFEMLWDIKGKKGAKNGTRGAYTIFKRLAEGVDNETCEAFTKVLMDDILKNQGECGYPEMHLTTYLNQERWDR